ncbi:hypothetical protein EIK77_004305 [Talaromyces pinophilus]|nr:hypothetical protein EIK77_004305 [Talaromyces pinophilus]PCG91422.1 hypothetical protein PENOC_097480 [Penicillium occitanis (nom. inval.)]PCG98977.1 Hypothetical protein PENO1_055410 [Penicillium occitanis (nom. inval.)]
MLLYMITYTEVNAVCDDEQTATITTNMRSLESVNTSFFKLPKKPDKRKPPEPHNRSAALEALKDKANTKTKVQHILNNNITFQEVAHALAPKELQPIIQYITLHPLDLTAFWRMPEMDTEDTQVSTHFVKKKERE